VLGDCAERGWTYCFWKALKQSESFAEITHHLIRLRHRLKRNLAITRVNKNDEEAVKVVYVDNCCNVCKVLQKCFPGALVKLNAFHWLKRWNEILHDPKSGHGGVFRALMSRALVSCGPDEFANAKVRLVKKGKTIHSQYQGDTQRGERRDPGTFSVARSCLEMYKY
jgi:hypothetical protein